MHDYDNCKLVFTAKFQFNYNSSSRQIQVHATNGIVGLFDKSLHLSVFNVANTKDKKIFLFSVSVSLA